MYGLPNHLSRDSQCVLFNIRLFSQNRIGKSAAGCEHGLIWDTLMHWIGETEEDSERSISFSTEVLSKSQHSVF
jgi:hypothetical protein